MPAFRRAAAQAWRICDHGDRAGRVLSRIIHPIEIPIENPTENSAGAARRASAHHEQGALIRVLGHVANGVALQQPLPRAVVNAALGGGEEQERLHALARAPCVFRPARVCIIGACPRPMRVQLNLGCTGVRPGTNNGADCGKPIALDRPLASVCSLAGAPGMSINCKLLTQSVGAGTSTMQSSHMAVTEGTSAGVPRVSHAKQRGAHAGDAYSR